MRRYDEALRKLNSLVAANPDFPVYYFVRSVVDWHQADLDAFVADQVMAMKKSGGADKAAVFESGYRKGKLKGACTGLIELLKNKSRTEYVSPYEIATMYAMMEDRDHTFEWLEKAYAERSGRMEYIKMDDFFEPFHSDPRYLELLRRMGMPR